MKPFRTDAVFAAAAILLSTNSAVLAHGWAGQRFFPATILTDDPFVADEISLPQVTVTPPGPDGAQSTAVEIDLSKRITPNTGFVIGDQWSACNHPVCRRLPGSGRCTRRRSTSSSSMDRTRAPALASSDFVLGSEPPA